MPTSLRQGSKLVRTIQVRGISGSVVVTMTHDGIEMRIPGTRIGVVAEWHRIAEALTTPGNVPSFLEGRPLEFLKYQATKKANK